MVDNQISGLKTVRDPGIDIDSRSTDKWMHTSSWLVMWTLSVIITISFGLNLHTISTYQHTTYNVLLHQTYCYTCLQLELIICGLLPYPHSAHHVVILLMEIIHLNYTEWSIVHSFFTLLLCVCDPSFDFLWHWWWPYCASFLWDVTMQLIQTHTRVSLTPDNPSHWCHHTNTLTHISLEHAPDNPSHWCHHTNTLTLGAI